MIDGVTGALPAVGRGRAKVGTSAGKTSRGAKVGSVALLTAAAGLALRNRGKIASTLSRDRSSGWQTDGARQADAAQQA
jgi:hypothetical protein